MILKGSAMDPSMDMAALGQASPASRADLGLMAIFHDRDEFLVPGY
jgi:hypothetical protein